MEHGSGHTDGDAQAAPRGAWRPSRKKPGAVPTGRRGTTTPTAAVRRRGRRWARRAGAEPPTPRERPVRPAPGGPTAAVLGRGRCRRPARTSRAAERGTPSVEAAEKALVRKPRSATPARRSGRRREPAAPAGGRGRSTARRGRGAPRGRRGRRSGEEEASPQRRQGACGHQSARRRGRRWTGGLRAAPRPGAQGPAGRPLPDVRAGPRPAHPGGDPRGSHARRALRAAPQMTSPRSTATSTSARCRTCSPAWRPRSSTSAPRRTPCSTAATCIRPRGHRRARRRAPRIEEMLPAQGSRSSCQVTKNPIGAKGARLITGRRSSTVMALLPIWGTELLARRSVFQAEYHLS